MSQMLKGLSLSYFWHEMDRRRRRSWQPRASRRWDDRIPVPNFPDGVLYIALPRDFSGFRPTVSR